MLDLSTKDSFNDGSDADKAGLTVSMSTTFYPQGDFPADLMIVTSPDNVFFAVHKHILLEKSANDLNGLLGNDVSDRPLAVEERASIFNLFLHVVYGYDPAQYKPSLDEIEGMLACLNKYGLSMKSIIVPGTPTYEVIRNIALSLPLDTFTVVCQYRLEGLAVDISRSLVDVSLDNLTDEHCIKMGPVYLRRLMFLHLGRTERLKTLLKEQPRRHPPTAQCDEVEMKRFLFAEWDRATTSLVWNLGPNVSVSMIRSSLTPCVGHLRCAECVTSMKEKIRQIIVDWTMTKSTI